jgi:hypothetical protein
MYRICSKHNVWPEAWRPRYERPTDGRLWVETSEKVHVASKTIELISQAISATGTISKLLGDEDGKDENAKPVLADSTCGKSVLHKS